MVIKSVDDCYISEAVVGYVILLFKETTAIMNLVDNYVLHFIWFLICLKDKKYNDYARKGLEMCISLFIDQCPHGTL